MYVQVVGLDTKKKAISLDSGHVITYDKCLLATGGRPKTLPVFDNAPASTREHVSVYRQVGNEGKGGGCVDDGRECLPCRSQTSRLWTGSWGRRDQCWWWAEASWAQSCLWAWPPDVRKGEEGGGRLTHFIACLCLPLPPDKERGLKVYQLFPECGNLGLVLPPALSAWTLDKVRKGE